MDPRAQIKQDFIKIIKGMIIGNILFIILGSIFIEERLPFILGLIFGSVIAVLNMRLLYLTLDKAVTMSMRRAQIFTVSRYILRYIIIGIVVYASLTADHLHPFGTIIGLLLIKPVILATQLFEDKAFLRNVFIRKKD
ncbi:ATP synthase subunit I [Isachenkonia alkalipeptolytica]|uniref:ATP synthase subunit I n=1 Tax=Isachenkonia alkalipeptolytica TaxID=2565777 RepID=A0AA43XL18_9CLOT|nr:ATP synthase subunit I [Isachenkonia alkalipeptolytica]NBG88336.1 ATP synthase subunit I [Isachenkonia alkalipeptolytica]